MLKVRKIGYGNLVIVIRNGRLERVERTTEYDNCDDGV